MKPTWKQIYPWIKTAVLNLDTIDSLLQQVVDQISRVYGAECLLWTGLELDGTDAVRVYATAGAADLYRSSLSLVQLSSAASEETQAAQSSVEVFYPRSLPVWLLEQQQSPQLMQLEAGDLIVPLTNRGGCPDEAIPASWLSVASPLQFVLQLSRPSVDASSVEPSDASPEPQLSFAKIQGWSWDELESLEVMGSQLGLAYSTLYWRQRLEQSRQQAALVGRISHLLNSTLNPDEIVGRIVAELGYGLQCDRSILVDLRFNPVNILAVWDQPDRQIIPLEERQADRHYWQNVIEMFTQGGASYLQLSKNQPEPEPLQQWLEAIGVQSVLLVPLFIQEEFFGAVALMFYQQERTYLIDELQTVRRVADQAAIALTNAQNYQSLWHKKEFLRQQNNTLQQEMMQDELTHLMNRRSLERELEQLSTATVWSVQPTFSIVACDIDYFKQVNDVYGHLIGDEVLQELAQRIQGQLRRGTPAYRYGGEEFVIILTDTPLEQAADVAERLRRTIRNSPIKTRVGVVEITASFGVAQQDLNRDRNAWEVLHRADQALYEAKRQGRDRVAGMA
ncbi:MAG TPA: sensor domain-containing diguanylate cyclase [Trichocoleus sp.]|jgi:diguanylate cyclase (GGDEF)-like protein